MDKILFVLSYMSEGDANSWKEEFFDSAEQIAAQTGTALTLGTYKNFIEEIEKDFSPYDTPKDAIYKMKELKLGISSIEEHVSKFKMLVTKSKLAKNDAVAGTLGRDYQSNFRRKSCLFLLPQRHSTNGTNGPYNSRTTTYGCRVLSTEHEGITRLPTRATRRQIAKDLEGSILITARKTRTQWMSTQ